MIELVLMLAFFAVDRHVEQLMQTPVIGTSREIVAADVRLFRVLNVTEARWHYYEACAHERTFDDEVRTYNRSAKYWQWKNECAWRQNCWRALIDALDPSCYQWPHRDREAIACRVHALEQLRRLLGDEAFWAGQMPCPIPSYNLLER